MSSEDMVELLYQLGCIYSAPRENIKITDGKLAFQTGFYVFPGMARGAGR